jgi:hypothetical protein
MAKQAFSFRWVTSPRSLAGKIEEHGERLLVAIHAVAVHVGVQMQNAARAGKPWTNRSGNAYSGLFFAVDGFGQAPVVGEVDAKALALKTDTATVSGGPERLVIVLGHTVYYGKFLELCNGGKYAIVMSTLESHLGVLEQMLRGLLERV